MSLDHLWAGWRSSYINAATSHDEPDGAGLATNAEGTLFERLAALSDADAHIVTREEHCFAILNAYPYTSGHLMVVPNRPVRSLEELDAAAHAALWDLVRRSSAAVQRAYSPEGMNIGLNLGAAGGAGVPDHLHVHVVPRWSGDTNFMTSVAGARVLPEPLPDTWARLVEAFAHQG
jgi:ATP adenylyltransferase